jgi:hypothetical protein
MSDIGTLESGAKKIYPLWVELYDLMARFERFQASIMV